MDEGIWKLQCHLYTAFMKTLNVVRKTKSHTVGTADATQQQYPCLNTLVSIPLSQYPCLNTLVLIFLLTLIVIRFTSWGKVVFVTFSWSHQNRSYYHVTPICESSDAAGSLEASAMISTTDGVNQWPWVRWPCVRVMYEIVTNKQIYYRTAALFNRWISFSSLFITSNCILVFLVD